MEDRVVERARRLLLVAAALLALLGLFLGGVPSVPVEAAPLEQAAQPTGTPTRTPTPWITPTRTITPTAIATVWSISDEQGAGTPAARLLIDPFGQEFAFLGGWRGAHPDP